MPPQPNSMSSGCAPKASNEALAGDFGVRFIGAVDRVSVDISNFRRVFGPKIGLFAKPGNIMRAVQHRLHPAKPRVARGADLFFPKGARRKRDVCIPSLMKPQGAIEKTGPHDFTIMARLDEIFGNIACRAAQGGIARPRDSNAFEQA